MRLVLLAVVAGVCLGTASLASALRAQTVAPIALTGQVTSAAEGPMEGVLVTARRSDSNVSVTVVSDEHGIYRFPASYLAPGSYGLRIRAVGYDLAGPQRVVVAAATTRADLRLVATHRLEDQISNAEWMVSMPGTDEQKAMLFGCTGCHTLQRVVDSYHTAAEFETNVLPRMESYANDSFWLKPQMFPNVRNLGRIPPGLADYLASINQSRGPRTWPLKTFAAPAGPVDARDPHRVRAAESARSAARRDRDARRDDLVLGLRPTILGDARSQDREGHAVPRPEQQAGLHHGVAELDRDRDGYFWLGNMYPRPNRPLRSADEDVHAVPVPPGPHPEFTQESMVMPTHDNVDGKVWTNNSGRPLVPAAWTRRPERGKLRSVHLSEFDQAHV